MRQVKILLKPERLFIIVAFLILSLPLAAQTKTEKEILPGIWMGKLESGVMFIRLVFNISLNEQDTLKASLESPDQGSFILPLGNVRLENDSIVINATMIAGRYSGKIKTETRIEGKWEQSGMTFELNIEKQDAPIKLNRPQEPKPPFPYRAEEVFFRNEKAGITLAGTLTIPEGDGPFPAAILITGSGPQNRDEEIMGHKPFAVIADHLTRNGIAVLRYDDRGVGKSEGVYTSATSADLATDAQAAFSYLQGVKAINKEGIGFIGHSEGGLIAPIAVTEGASAAWIISLAGPGVNGESVLLKQAEDISRAMGTSEEDLNSARKINQKLYTIIRKTPDKVKAESKLTKTLTKELIKLDVQDEVINERVASIKLTMAGDAYPWWRYFFVTEPATFWTKVTCPVLILNGEKDLQVSAAINTSAIAGALQKGGNNSFRVHIFPGLNHLFQHSETGLPGEYSSIEETMSAEVLSTMSAWIREISF